MPLQTATVGKGINIVLMGDGYTDRDMVDHGLYETLMNQAMEEFFDIEPYKSFRDEGQKVIAQSFGAKVHGTRSRACGTIAAAVTR